MVRGTVRLAITVAAVSVVGAPLTLGAQLTAPEGQDSRLEGKFKTLVTVTDSDWGQRGETARRTYAFTTPCDVGPCMNAVFKREEPGHGFIRSTLNRRSPRIFRGTEGPVRNFLCPKSPGRGSQTADHTVKTVKAVDGQATAIRGYSKYRITGCGSDDLIQRVKFSGTVR